MAAYRKTSKLSREDAAYIAELIDGEGTLSLTRRHRGENRVDRRRDWAEAAGRHRNMDAARHTHQSTVPCQTRQLLRRLIEIGQVLQFQAPDQNTLRLRVDPAADDFSWIG